ncbi:MAG TPA: response regulator [Terriglobales bacterium]|nr:response regulator [Terriglobales bacterium]
MEERTTVLYVDDNPKSSRLLASVLEECGFRMISKTDPLDALALCRRTSFDLALLDYEMPVMSGAQLAREIKGMMPEVPIVLISGRTSIPAKELEFVDAHFGFGTALDDLLWSMRILSPPKLVRRQPTTTGEVEVSKGRPAPAGRAGRYERMPESRWADLT